MQKQYSKNKSTRLRNQLIRLHEEEGIPVAELADYMGMKQYNLSRLLRTKGHKRPPRAKTVERMAACVDYFSRQTAQQQQQHELPLRHSKAAPTPEPVAAPEPTPEPTLSRHDIYLVIGTGTVTAIVLALLGLV